MFISKRPSRRVISPLLDFIYVPHGTGWIKFADPNGFPIELIQRPVISSSPDFEIEFERILAIGATDLS
jgi:hypothetical protein